MTLNAHYKKHKIKVTEGFAAQTSRKKQLLKDLAKTQSHQRIMEIGFNGGHSAELFLKHNKSARMTSFDIGEHNYVIFGKSFIDNNYPFRHQLIIGDSQKTVPEFTKKYPDVKFDLIFIDGGHKFEIAKADLVNCKHLAHPETLVIMDDTIFTPKWEKLWTIGPSKAWRQAVASGLVHETSREDFGAGSGWSWGKYVFPAEKDV